MALKYVYRKLFCNVYIKIKETLQKRRRLAIEKKEHNKEKRGYDPNVIRIAFVNYSGHGSFILFTSVFDQFVTYSNNRLKYMVVKKYRPDIVIFSVFGDKKEIDKFDTPYKIFNTGENVSENAIADDYKQYFDNCVNETKLSVGFDFENTCTSDNYIRYPLGLQCFFRPFFNKDDIKKKLDEFGSRDLKQKFCSLISRHDIRQTRTAMYERLSEIGRIDCPSALFHNDNTLKTEFNDNKCLYLRQYKFNICPENSLTKGYVTEKLWEALYSGCIPIYACGNTEDPEPGIINPDIFIGFNPNNIDDAVVKEVKLLNENERLLKSWWEKPIFCDTAVDKIYEILQKYNKKMYEIIENVIQEKQAKNIK